MTTYRLKYKKGDTVKYISHLDTVQVFSRAIRRADLPASYSQGFNPKVQIVFGVPAAVGMTSDSEIIDLTLDEEITCDELKNLLNNNLPDGLKIEKCIIKDTEKNIMALTKASDYVVKISTQKGLDYLKEAVDKILDAREIIVPKRTKNGVKDVNIREMIYEAKVENDYSLKLLLTSGNEGSLKPELFIDALNKINPSLQVLLVYVHRTGMYMEGEEGLIDPFTKEQRWYGK